MTRPPVVAVEEKVRIVLSILAGEVTVAELSLIHISEPTRLL